MPSTPKPSVKKPALIKLGGKDSGIREGKGFSLNELKEVGLDLNSATRLGIPVDKRRKSSWHYNVEVLRQFLNRLKYTK